MNLDKYKTEVKFTKKGALKRLYNYKPFDIFLLNDISTGKFDKTHRRGDAERLALL